MRFLATGGLVSQVPFTRIGQLGEFVEWFPVSKLKAPVENIKT